MAKATKYNRQQVMEEDRKDRELQSLRELLESERNARMKAEAENKILRRRVEIEDSLWRSDTAKRRLEPGADIHVMHSREVLDDILRDEDLLVRVTKFTPEKFDFLLDKFNGWLMAHPRTAPLFSSDDTRSGERGNRCKLEPKYVLLMALIHYKSDPTQDSLEAQFAIDQSSVSRYLKLAKMVLDEILPTGKNVYKRIQNAKTAEDLTAIMRLGSKSDTTPEANTVEPPVTSDGNADQVTAEAGTASDDKLRAQFTKILGLSPAFELNESQKKLFEEFKWIKNNLDKILLLDGTHVRTVRPGNADKRRSRYSGKKKYCSFNTNIMSTGNGLIAFVSESVDGSTHDLTLLRKDAPSFKIWNKSVELVRGIMDKGYGGIEKDGHPIQIETPTKNKPKTGRLGGLTQEERDRNKMISAIRISVEHAIGRIKQHARVAGPYAGTAEEFSQDFSIATGLTNFHHIWDDIRNGRFEIG